MKRYLSLALIFLMLPAFLAVPAIADEINNNFINVLDYGVEVAPSDGVADNTFILTPTGENTRYTIRYDLPQMFSVGTIELLVKTDSTNFSFSNNGDGSSPYTIMNLGNGYYRIIGESGRTLDRLYFYLFYSNGSYCQLLSFRISTVPYQKYIKTASGRLYFDGYGYRDFYYTGEQFATIMLENTANPNAAFHGSFDVAGWQTMDYIQLGFFIRSTTLNTFNPQIGGISVPYSINTVLTNERNGVAVSYVYMLLDVSGFPKNSSSSLTVSFSGVVGANVDGEFSLAHCLGLVETPTPSLWTHWFSQVGTWISNQTSALVSPIVTWGQNIVNSVSTWGQNLLDGINALPDKIAEALEAVFVPSDSVVQDMGQQSEELAQDRFGGAYEGALIIDEFASQLRPQQVTQILTVPVVNLDILGVPFPLGGWEVDLVPDGTEIVVETCKIIIDIIATLAFINGLRNRLERTLER